ncbi:MAG: DNA polymerase III subunit gamma/tau, partial [Clostridia bacterium]|nr:DNA polymerase III subunit gamma/tau [Clostridia bacterium]
MKTIAPIAAFFRVRLRERGFKMAHQAIYRRWRPMVFEDIIGQGHITKTLKNQIIGGKVGHAYLFCGTRGTGKTTCAKVLSCAVNCLNPKDGSPCNECEICKGLIDGSIMDVKELDAASNNGVDTIREIRDDVQYVSAITKYTVYIIDEVHMLSTGAFNALLKTLEEPPEHVIFILATTEVHKVPETIRSRCQRFDFRRIKPSDIIVRMKEIAHGDGLNITEDAYKMLGRLADGSMRDGLSILERVVSAEGNEVTAESITNVLGISTADSTFKITDAVLKGDAAGIVSVIDDVLSEGKDLKVFMDSLIKCFRDMMLCKVTDKTEAVLDLDPTDMIKLKSLAEKMTFEKLSHAVSVLSDAAAEAKWVKSPRIIYELALIKISRPEFDNSPEALMDRLTSLENKVSAGAVAD